MGTRIHNSTDFLICEVIGKMSERNMVNLTVTVSKDERRALKQMALDRDTTVSALVREWLQENREPGTYGPVVAEPEVE